MTPENFPSIVHRHLHLHLIILNTSFTIFKASYEIESASNFESSFIPKSIGILLKFVSTQYPFSERILFLLMVSPSSSEIDIKVLCCIYFNYLNSNARERHS